MTVPTPAAAPISPAALAAAAADLLANPPTPPETDLAADAVDCTMIGKHRARQLSAGDLWLIKKLVAELKIKDDIKGLFTSGGSLELADLEPLGDFLMCMIYIICQADPVPLVAVVMNNPEQFVADAARWGFDMPVVDLVQAVSIIGEYKQTLQMLSDSESDGEAEDTGPK